MIEFYSGKSDAGESVYYAGGQAGENAILAYVDPENSQIATFIGPTTLSEDGLVTVTDSTTSNTMTFSVSTNGDGTLTLDMGADFGKATVSTCSSDEIVDALTQATLNAPQTTTTSN